MASKSLVRALPVLLSNNFLSAGLPGMCIVRSLPDVLSRQQIRNLTVDSSIKLSLLTMSSFKRSSALASLCSLKKINQFNQCNFKTKTLFKVKFQNLMCFHI